MKPESTSMKPNRFLQFAPTVGSALGMLLFGVGGAVIGIKPGSEWFLCALAVIGMVGGSLVGALVTTRWLNRDDKNEASK